MKQSELIDIIGKYLNKELRKIIHEEMNLVFKELFTNAAQEVKKETVRLPANQRILVQTPTKMTKPKPIVETGNEKLNNILLETAHEIARDGPIPLMDESEIYESIGIPGMGSLNQQMGQATNLVGAGEYQEDPVDISNLSTVNQAKVNEIFNKDYSELVKKFK